MSVIRLKQFFLALALVLANNTRAMEMFDIGIFHDPGGTNVTSLSEVRRNSIIDLSTIFSTDMDLGPSITAIQYVISVPTAGWTLLSRNYSDYGSVTVPGVPTPLPADFSSPTFDSIPTGGLSITQNLFVNSSSDPGKFDVFFSASHNSSAPGSVGIKGANLLIEDFSIKVPNSLLPGAYEIEISEVAAFFAGDPLLTTQPGDGTLVPTTAGFTVNAIPEPSTYVLFAMMFIGIGWFLNRRKKKLKSISSPAAG